MSVRVAVIVGPTASGKTHLGVEVAHALGSEILSADSRQVYRGLDIGTGKDLDVYARVDPPVPCHLIDLVDPEEIYTLFRFQRDCYSLLSTKTREDRFSGGRVPLVMVGGSGLYVEAVVRDFRIADVPENAPLRVRLEGRTHEELAELLDREAPDLKARTDLSSRRRLIRALEIAAHGRTAPLRFSEPPEFDLRFTVFAVRIGREELRRRIGVRLRSRLEGGMVEEVQGLLDRGLPPRRLEELGLEYREIAAYLDGAKSYEAMTADLEAAIGRFAKRQQTWFRGMERRGVSIQWIDSNDVETVVAQFCDP